MYIRFQVKSRIQNQAKIFRNVAKCSSHVLEPVALQGGAQAPHWPKKYAKYVFSAFEANFCSKNENSPPMGLALGQHKSVNR